MPSTPDKSTSIQSFPISDRYSVEFDTASCVLWSTWRDKQGPYFSPALLKDMRYGISTIEDGSFSAADLFHYFVLRSRSERVFNLGGDLAFFRDMIVSRDSQGLLSYASQSADMMFSLYSGMGRDATTIALVQGQCLGGGFEAAVAYDYLFAERDAEFSFPEIQLGIFPGMGALLLLARNLSRMDYEDICHSGRTFRADELKARGVIDVVVDRGCGEQAVGEFVKKRTHALRSHREMAAIRKSAAMLSREDFHAGLACWVDIVMSLDKRRLAMLELAIRKQRQTPRAE